MSSSNSPANSPFRAISQGVVANVLGMLATVVGGIIAARGLGSDGRGEAAALISLPTFVAFVANLGLPTALVYEARREPARAPALVAAAVALATLAGIAAWIATWMLTPTLLHTQSTAIIATARAFAVFVLTGLLSNAGMAALQSAGEFRAANAIRLAQPLVQVAGLVVLALAGAMTPTAVALLTFTSGAPGLAWNLAWIARRYRPRAAELPGAVVQLVNYGVRAAGGEFLTGMTGQIDKIIVVGIFSPSVLGLYVVAMSLSRVLAVIPTAVVPVLFPTTAGRSPGDVATLTSRAAAMTLVCVTAGAACVGVAGPWLLAALYGRDFHAAGWGFRLLLLESALSAVAQVLSQAFMAMNRPGLYGVQQGLGVGVAVALLFACAPRYGLEGAAAALLASSAVRLAAIYWCYAHVLRIGQPRLVAHLGPSVATLWRVASGLWPRPSLGR